MLKRWSGRISVRSGVDTRVVNGNAIESRLLANRHLTQPTVEHRGDTILVEVQTTQSKIRIATAALTTVSGADGQPTAERVDGQPMMRSNLAVTGGRAVVVGKLVAVATSRDAAVASPGDGALAELHQHRMIKLRNAILIFGATLRVLVGCGRGGRPQ